METLTRDQVIARLTDFLNSNCDADDLASLYSKHLTQEPVQVTDWLDGDSAVYQYGKKREE